MSGGSGERDDVAWMWWKEVGWEREEGVQKEKGKQSCKLAEEEGCERNPFRYALPARTPPPEARASLGPGHPRPVRGGVRSMGLARRTRVVHRQ